MWTVSARREMVRCQLVARGILDARVLEAMAECPRHAFVPREVRERAYEDSPLPIGEGQTISQPYMVALLAESLALRGPEKVLDVGTGSGYQAAILARLAREVVSIERLPALASRARSLLAALGVVNVRVVEGDGSQGLPAEAPFQGVCVAAAAPEPPPALVHQLAEGGRLVVPVGFGPTQDLILVTREKGAVRRSVLCESVFVPLIGRGGFPGEG